MTIQFSSFQTRLPTIHCATEAPDIPITPVIEDKVARALLRLPTSDRRQTLVFSELLLPVLENLMCTVTLSGERIL